MINPSPPKYSYSRASPIKVDKDRQSTNIPVKVTYKVKKSSFVKSQEKSFLQAHKDIS